jgi:antitoxin MazE
MIAKIVPIGNSRGIRIPNHILQHLNAESHLELVFDEQKNEIILKPVREVRQGWGEAFRKMKASGDDSLIINDSLDINDSDWEW